MAITTYADLRSEVAAWLNRSDMTDHAPRFIEFATARFNRELRVPDMEAYDETTIDNEWTSLPDDFLAIRLIEAQGKVLEYRTPWQLQKLVEASAVPVPPVYTISDLMFRVYPFQTGLPVELLYYERIPALSNDADSNWLLLQSPDVYLHAALAAARHFLHDDARIAQSEQFVRAFIADANRAGRRIAHGSAPMAIRVA